MTGDFLPGHDQRLRAELENRLAALVGGKRSGLLVARDLVAALVDLKERRITEEAFLVMMKAL